MKTLKRLSMAVLLVGVLIIGVTAVSAQRGAGNPDGRGRGGGNGGNQRLGALVDGAGQGDLFGCMAEGYGLRVRVQVLRLAAQQTGLTTREIRSQIDDGATLGAILLDNGVDVDTFTAEVTERAEARLNLAVANDRITQEQADELLAQFQERLNGALTPAL